MTEHRAISRPLSEIKASYTVVVVGSGYGGGVAASRMARAGQTVCVLERGREILPGHYPKTLMETKDEIQVDTKLGHTGSRTGMLDLRMNDDVNVVLGCGLGGTSLINANVALEMKTDLFKYNEWPEAFRTDPNVLDPYYKRAKSMLDPVAYPDHYPKLNKLKTLKMSADAMGLGDRYYTPPINVTFQDRVNQFGVPQAACNNCGDCCSGCNYGAKNTTLMNYLPDANNHGAEIFTEASVRYLEKVADGWIVHIESVDRKDLIAQVKAEIVMLGAGTLGSTEILKRSEQMGLKVSPTLGERFSGNGDILGFGYNSLWKKDGEDSYEPIYGVGKGGNDIKSNQMPGPTIAGIIDLRNGKNVEDRLVIEEGVIPGPTAAVLAPLFFSADAEFGNFMEYGPIEAGERLKQAQKLATAIQKGGSTTGLAYEGPVARTQTYLIMSHDDAKGKLELENDSLRVHWKGAGSEHAIVHGNKLLKEAAEGIEAQFIPNLMWMEQMGRKIVTVHPIGGCCMGDTMEHGVVNDRCNVFSGQNTVHEGLYVCDGAVIPGALGVNPLLTISAIAERACHLLATERGWTINYDFGKVNGTAVDPITADEATEDVRITAEADKPEHSLLKRWLTKLLHAVEHEGKEIVMDVVDEVAKLFPDAVSPGLSFTETMEGHYSGYIDPRPAPVRERISNPYITANADGKAIGQKNRIDFKLTISTPDIAKMIDKDPDHAMSIEGLVHCDALSALDMSVDNGRFCLLKADPDSVDTFLMTYDMVMQRKDNGPLFFHGSKYLRQEPGSSPWGDLTTLYVDIYDGVMADKTRLIGRALMTLDMDDLVRQVSTFKFPASSKFIEKHKWLDAAFEWVFVTQFAGFFAQNIMQVYGGLLADLNNYDEKEDRQRVKRPLRVPAPKIHHIEALDGAAIRLLQYECSGSQHAVVMAPGFSVAAASFAADTVEENVVEYLHRFNHEVWLFDYRASPDSGSSTKPFTVDDIVTSDWPAAIKFIREKSSCTSLQAVVHCIGSMSLLMSVLNGLQGVDSIISSQLTLHPVTNWLNDLKADIGLASLIKHIKAPSMKIDFEHTFDMRSSDSEPDKLIDTVMYQIPVPAGEECNNPCCRRVFGIFGPSWTHANLNHETHIALREWFGELSTTPFQQLSDMISAEKAQDAQGRDVYLPNVGRLKLPITFIAGSENQVFVPETSKRTYDWICAHNGPELYARRVFEGYAHMDFWIGKNASKDIFPEVLKELENLRSKSKP